MHLRDHEYAKSSASPAIPWLYDLWFLQRMELTHLKASPAYGQSPQALMIASKSVTLTAPSPPSGAMSAGPPAAPQLATTARRSLTFTAPLPSMSAGHA